MIKRMAFSFKVNASLAKLGCAPGSFRQKFRELSHDFGFAESLTPEEVAVMMVKSLGIGEQPDGWEVAAAGWLEAGQLRAAIWEGPSMFEVMQRAAERRGLLPKELG